MSDIQKVDESVSLDDNSIKDLLKQLVNESIKYNQKQTELIKEFLKKKVRNGKFAFRFPFVLKEEHINKFNDCINKRLKDKYGETYKLDFVCEIEYKNHDIITCEGLEELFIATHDEPMLRLHMQWTYTVDEILDEFIIPVPYDINVYYEIEQDSDKKELYTLEEWGMVRVENSNSDWINETLRELRSFVDATRMPFWWYYPKKVFLAIREHLNYIFYLVGLVIATIVILMLFNKQNSSVYNFISELKDIPDVSSKLQAYIEYTLTPKDNKYVWISYLLILLSGGILGQILSKCGRVIFPPSMILIGNLKTKLSNKIKAYAFIWSPIVLGALGGIVTLIINLLK